jgi:hypothetical protein
VTVEVLPVLAALLVADLAVSALVLGLCELRRWWLHSHPPGPAAPVPPAGRLELADADVDAEFTRIAALFDVTAGKPPAAGRKEPNQ